MSASRIAFGNLTASTVSCILIRVIAPPGFPRSIYILDLMICFLATSGLRLILRMMLEVTSKARSGRGVEKSTLIYGAGGRGPTWREIPLRSATR
jgi:FlaA1/EpsC-like NDP-sugar epimerase